MKVFSVYSEYLTPQEAADFSELNGLRNEVIRRTAFHKDRVGSETLKMTINMLEKDIDSIVETALIRHLELWVESLNEEVKVDEFNNLVFEGNLYSGILYRETIDGTWRYFKSPTENSEEILYASNGDILYYRLSGNVVQYLLENKWYVIQTDNGKHIFNLVANNPVAIKDGGIGGVPSKFLYPFATISQMICEGGIVTEMK